MKIIKNTFLIGLFTALASSLCCIIPFLSIIAGIAGGATVFSFIEPYRPYLMLITASVLSVGFYQEYKSRNLTKMRACCVAGAEKKSKRNKRYLWVIAVVSTLLFFFPYYSGIFVKSGNTQTAQATTMKNIELKISGMSCQGCANNIMLNLSKVEGVQDNKVNFDTKKASISFDENKVSGQQIIKSIEEIGYKVEE